MRRNRAEVETTRGIQSFVVATKTVNERGTSGMFKPTTIPGYRGMREIVLGFQV